MRRSLSRICSFSIHEDKVSVLDRLQKLADQERESLSHMIVVAIEEFLKKHEPGNPQKPLGVFGVKPILTCWKCGGKFVNVIHVEFISGLSVYLCSTCLEKEKGKGGYCTIKKVLK